MPEGDDDMEIVVTLITGSSFVIQPEGRDAHNVAQNIARGATWVADTHGGGEATYYPASQVASVKVRAKDKGAAPAG